MTYSPTGFMRGLEGGIQSMAMAAANAAAQERSIDRSGPLAVARLTGALRSERRKTAALARELAAVYERLAIAEDALSRLPLGRR